MTFNNLLLIPAQIDLVEYQDEPIEAGLLDLPIDEGLEIMDYTKDQILKDLDGVQVDYVIEGAR